MNSAILWNKALNHSSLLSWLIMNEQTMSNNKNDMTNNDDAIVTKIYYDDRWQELLWQKMMRTMYDRQEWLWRWWYLFKNKNNNNNCNDEQTKNLSKKIICDADVMKSLCASMIFLSSISQFSAIVDVYLTFF